MKITITRTNVLPLLVVPLVIAVVIAVFIRANNSSLPENYVHVIDTKGDTPDKHYNYTLSKYHKSLVSSNVTPDDWNQIVQLIGKNYSKHGAFVIYGGKDTLPYTASALAFMMENTKKPIILTSEDLQKVSMIASSVKFPEVMIYDNKQLLRGCRTIIDMYGNLVSPNYPPLKASLSLKMPQEPTSLKFINPAVNVIILKVFPGIDPNYMKSIAENGNINGVILESAHHGNIPNDQAFLDSIKQMAEKDVVIIALSYDGQSDIKLLEAGVLPGYDMTCPAAYTKLLFLLSNIQDRKIIAQLLEVNFRGEMNKM